MDERGAALQMLKRLNCSHPYIVLMDRGYESFNLIENCNRLSNCYYVIRAKTSFSKNTRDQRWDFGNFCDIKFRACKIKVNDPDTGK